MYKPGDSYCKVFTTASPTSGAATNADAPPVAIANRNGVDDPGFSSTVTNLDVGRYKITGTVPSSYAKGDVVNVSVAATVGGVAGKAAIDSFVVDSKRIGDLNDSAPAPTVAAVASAILATPANKLSTDAGGAVALTAAGLDNVVVEAGINARQALSPILAAAGGTLTGAGTGTIVIRGGNSSQARIAASTDNAGNRTSVTLTLPN